MTAGHDDLLAELASAAGAPWAIMPERATALSAIVADVSLGRDIAPARIRTAINVSAPARAARRPDIIPGPRDKGAIAVVPVHGLATWGIDFMPFAFSTKKLASTMQELAADKSIGAVVLDFATPGGMVTGTPEASTAIFAARNVKPVMAIVDPLAASAGYWMAASATSIAITPSGETGSIGVFGLHLDLSAALDAAGIVPTFVFAGERKIDGNAFQPLSDRARSDFQNDVDRIYGDFLGAVARGRGVPVATVRSTFGQGRTLMAREAVKVGMVDRIETFDVALARFILAAPRSAGASRSVSASRSVPPDPAARRRRLALLRQR